jgi:hypothetical protein
LRFCRHPEGFPLRPGSPDLPGTPHQFQFQFQFLRGPPTLTPPSRRTAPLPSVNTSTEYSLARATQFR